nr:ABC transporter permease subunit [Komagataeibacter oboediens]
MGHVFSGVVAVLYALPPITLGPLLVLAFRSATSQVILAAICVCYPTLQAMRTGLRDIDPRLKDVVTLYGGSAVSTLWYVRLRSGLPALFAGLRIAPPAAIQGAVLAEFGSGAPGTGSALLAAIGRGIPSKLWAVALVATFFSAVVYGLVAQLRRMLTGKDVPATRQPGHETAPHAGRWEGMLWAGMACMLPLVIWQCLPWPAGVPPILFRPPSAVFRYLVTGPWAHDVWATFVPAMVQTVPLAVGGMIVGLVPGFLLAVAVWSCKRAEPLVMQSIEHVPHRLYAHYRDGAWP